MSSFNIDYNFMGTNEDLEHLSIISNGYNNDLLPISQMPLTYFPIYNNVYINNLVDSSTRVPTLNDIKIVSNKYSVEITSKTTFIYIKFTSIDETIFEVEKDMSNVVIYIVNGGSLTTAGVIKEKTFTTFTKGRYKVNIGEGQKKDNTLHERGITTLIKENRDKTTTNIHTTEGFTTPTVTPTGAGIIILEDGLYYGKQITYRSGDEYSSRTSIENEGSFTFNKNGQVYINDILLDTINFELKPYYVYKMNNRIYIYATSSLTTTANKETNIKLKYPMFEYNFLDNTDIGKDSSVNESHLLSLGDTRLTINEVDRALVFNGSGYLEKRFNKSLYDPIIFSISFWFKASVNDFNDVNRNSIILGCSPNPDEFKTAGGWALYFENKEIRLCINGGQEAIDGYRINMNIPIADSSKYYHIVIVCNNKVFSVYGDTKLLHNANDVKIIYKEIDDGIFFIGKPINMFFDIGKSKLNGSSIKDLRFYNYDLTVDDVRKIYTKEYNLYDIKEYYFYTSLSQTSINEKLKAWYKFDDANDIGKNTIDAANSLINTVADNRPQLNYTNKRKGTSSLLLTTNKYLVKHFINDINKIFSPDIFSISFWIKVSQADINRSVNTRLLILGCYTFPILMANYRWCIALSNKRIFIYISNETNSDYMNVYLDIPNDRLTEWNHIVFTFYNKDIVIYLNKNKGLHSSGQKFYQSYYNSILTGVFFIGGVNYINYFSIAGLTNFEAFSESYIDDLRIYHHELDETQVEELYEDRIQVQNMVNSQTAIDNKENTGSNGDAGKKDGKNGVLIIKYANLNDNGINIVNSINKIEGENIKTLNEIKQEFDIKIKQLELTNDKPYNKYNIYPLTIIITITWILMIVFILKYISYYYPNYYIYILLIIIIMMLVISSIWFLYVNNNLLI